MSSAVDANDSSMGCATPLDLSSRLLHSIEQVTHSLVHPTLGRTEDLKVIYRLKENIHRSLYALRQLHNALRPINQLPPEILGLIFKFTQDGFADRVLSKRWRTREPKELRPYRDVYLLAHVCQYFRSVAIATPSLWSTLVFYDNCPRFSFYKLYIHRSWNLSLDLYFSDCENLGFNDSDSSSSCYTHRHDGNIEFLDIIEIYASRTRSLIIDEYAKFPVGSLNFEELDMPLLETIVIPGNAGDLVRILETSGFPRMVAVTQATVRDWPGEGWHHLTSFTFHCYESYQKTLDGISNDDIIEFLSTCPQLRILDLEGMGTVRGSTSMNQRTIALALNRLQYIYLTWCHPDLINLIFDSFSFSPNFDVHISPNYADQTHDSDPIDKNILHPAFLTEPIVDLVITCNDRDYFTVIFSSRRGSITCRLNTSKLIPTFQKIDPSLIQTFHFKIFDYYGYSFCRDAPFQFLEQVNSLSSLSISVEDRMVPCSKIPALYSIMVIEESGCRQRDDLEPTNHNVKVHSPNLSTLTIHGTSPFNGPEDRNGYFKPIFDLLQKRSEAGCVLERLVFVCPDNPNVRFGVIDEMEIPGVKVIEVVRPKNAPE